MVSLIRQQQHTQHAQQGRAWRWERSPPGRGGRKKEWQVELPALSSSQQHRLRGCFCKKRRESELSKGHKKGKGNKICMYIPHVFLGSLVTNPTTRPPHKEVMHAYPYSVKLKTWTGLHLRLHLFLCIGIKKPKQTTIHHVKYYPGSLVIKHNKKQRNKVFNPLLQPVSSILPRSENTRKYSLIT